MFNLCIDDFAINYNSLDDAYHLINVIQKYFKCSIDWEVQNYLSLTLDCNHAKKYVDISMPGYITNLFYNFQHKPTSRDQDDLHTWNKIVYGKQIQLATHQSSTPKLNSVDNNRVQPTNNNFLYYDCAVDTTIPRALNEISNCQFALTQYTLEKFNKLLDYLSMYPNATIRYHASDMIIMTDTDSDYLVLPSSHSCISGHYYFTNRMSDYSKVTPTTNGPILTEFNTLKTVISSSAEAETVGTFKNA